MSCTEFIKENPEEINKDIICKLIMATKLHKYSNDKLINIMIDLDLDIFNKSIIKLIDYEDKIFKEYQYINIVDYIPSRISVLNKLQDQLSSDNIPILIEYIKNRTYRIGIYPGSFNPFHIGHLNIVQKAEKILDKIIIARGINPDKNENQFELPKDLNNEIINYSGMVTELFNDIHNVELFLIRGLRNVYDLGYEENMRKTILDINPTIKFIYLFCDSQYEHISSSLIRGLLKFDRKIANKYLPELKEPVVVATGSQPRA